MWLKHVIIPMSLGILIYLFFRDKDSLIIHKFITNLPNYNSNVLSSFFRYNLPDGLWLYASMMSMVLIWRKTINRHSVFWIILLPILALFTEGVQFLEPAYGTFDVRDIFVYFLATMLCFVQCNFNFSHKII